MLVGAGEEQHVLAAQPVIARRNVHQRGGVGVSEVRFRVHIEDRRGGVVGSRLTVFLLVLLIVSCHLSLQRRRRIIAPAVCGSRRAISQRRGSMGTVSEEPGTAYSTALPH